MFVERRDRLERWKSSKITRKASKWQNQDEEILIPLIYFLQGGGKGCVVRPVSMKNAVSAIRAPRRSRDLPAHRSASYIANSLPAGLSRWFSMATEFEHLPCWAEQTWNLYKTSGGHWLIFSFAQFCWSGRRMLGKYKHLMWGISALMHSFWSLLQQSTYHLSAAYPANFLSLSLNK